MIPSGFSFRALRVSTASALSLLCAAALSLLISSCVDHSVAGTSSGWDNPSVMVAFVRSSGGQQKVSGELKIFASEQNPAVDPNPIARIRLTDDSAVQLTRKDFERGINDTSLSFNLEFQGDSGTGALALGLAYHAGTVSSGGVAVSKLDMRPGPLVRYIGEVALQPVHGVLGRVFVPGTDFQATLVDSHFVFMALPSESMPLRLMNSDGKIFAVAESLDTRADKVYTVDSIVLTQLPILPVPQASAIRLDAGPPREAFVGTSTLLETGVTNAKADDARLSILWRCIGAHDTNTIRIEDPTRLKTSVTFKQEGAYLMEVNATLLRQTARDTLVFSVRNATAASRLRVVQPKADDTLAVGERYGIAWEMPVPGPVTLLYSSDGGAVWDTLAQHSQGASGLPVFLWTPHAKTSSPRSGLIEVRSESDTATARSTGGFSVLELTTVGPP